MSAFHFYLKDKNSKQSSLQVVITAYKRRKRIGIGITITSANWDFKKERLNKNKILSLAEQKDNQQLDKIEELYLKNKHLSLDEIQDILKRYITTGTISKTSTLIEAFDLVIDVSPFKEGTIKSYKGTRELLKGFRDVPLNSVNLDYAEGLINHMHGLSYHKNTVGRHIKNIKSVMSKTLDRGLHENLSYRRFKVAMEEIDNIALTLEEIEKLKKLKLSGQQELIRDLFLLGCYTGLRFSDFNKIKSTAISNNILSISKTQKTGEKIVVPLKKDAIGIIDKYGELPPSPENQVFNKSIKKIAKKAEIMGSETISKTKGGVLEPEVKDRSELVKTHTARRTFATNAYKAGVPAISIMKITGHKTERAFLNYIKVSKQEHAELMAKHSFFS